MSCVTCHVSYVTTNCHSHHLKPFGLGTAVQPGEDMEDTIAELMNELMKTVFVEQSLALPRSVKDMNLSNIFRVIKMMTTFSCLILIKPLMNI